MEVKTTIPDPFTSCPYSGLHQHMSQCTLCGYSKPLFGNTREPTIDEEFERMEQWARERHPDWFRR
jgi:hypothetical protein